MTSSFGKKGVSQGDWIEPAVRRISQGAVIEVQGVDVDDGRIGARRLVVESAGELLQRRDRRDGPHAVMRLTDPPPAGAGGCFQADSD
jgi:hypothetical protein